MGLTIVENRDAAITALCSLIESTAKDCIANNNSFNIGISGGSIVQFLVAGLPKVTSDFTKWKIFFCDERLVTFEDPESTFGTYKRQLISKKVVPLREDQFVVIKQGFLVSTEEAAEAYEMEIKNYVKGNPLPQFDLLVLGMGEDGHTCSLFPGHKLLEEKSKWVAPITDSPKAPPCRITLTFPIINNAKVCVFAVSGKEKAKMIKIIHVDKKDLPAARVKPVNGQLHWIVDKDAAALLN